MNKKIRVHVLLFGFFCVMLLGSVQAATFCISTSAELQAALDIADSNNQDDHIKLRFGVYTAPTNGFVYTGITEDHDLEISGNWFTFNNNSCGSRILAGDPLGHSTLDGNDTASALNIIPGAVGDITISYVVLTNGDSSDFGGGLRLFPVAEYLGNVLIENSVFVQNRAENDGAIYIVGGKRLVLRNNLIIENAAYSGSGSVFISQENSAAVGMNSGVHFTNNTVMDNYGIIGHSSVSGEVSIIVNDASQALVANNLIWDNGMSNLYMPGNGYKFLFNNNFPHSQSSIIGMADEMSGNLSVVPVFETGVMNFKPALNSAISNRGKMPPTFGHVPPHFDEIWSLGTLDLSGEARVFGTSVDIGAIESDSLSDLIFEDDFE